MIIIQPNKQHFGKSNPFFGKRHSLKTKRAISLSIRQRLKPLLERFKIRYAVDKNGCWLWQAKISKNGYGIISLSKTNSKLAHRVSYELFIGRVPNNFLVCHTCDVRSCVNPKHLFLGTQWDNVQDMVKKGRNAIGECLPQAKLTDKDVINIRKENTTMREAANKYNVSVATICRIINKQIWKHIK